MKYIALASLIALLPLHADTVPTPSPWAVLDAQAVQMAQAAKDRDTHVLHQLDHAIHDEVAALKTPATPAPLAADLDAVAGAAEAAHRDAHAGDWDRVAADQAALAQALHAAETKVTGKTN